MRPAISVIVPTVKGREEHLARCLAAYESTPVDLELIVIHDRPTCGEAWNAGVKQARGEYIHFTADDLEPHDGWHVPAIEAVQAGTLPAPRLVNQHGKLDSCGIHGVEMEDWAKVPMSVVPFMSREQWDQIGPSLNIHYFSDNWLSHRGKQLGWPPVVRRGFAFTHWWAQVGRGAGMGYEQRMAYDKKQYFDAVRAETRGVVRA